MSISAKVILLVDDSLTIRRTLEWSLKAGGWKLLQAADGLQALDILRQSPVDLAFVDLNMPRMDGIELIRAIRADEKLRRLPVILLTTESREIDREAAVQAGANLYLTKPYSPALLREHAESFLKSSPAAAAPLPREQA